MSSAVERAQRVAWQRGALQLYRGRCDVCGRTRDETGALLLVARQARQRKRECIDCFDERVSR